MNPRSLQTPGVWRPGNNTVFTLISVLLLTAAGCGGSGQSVEGTVTLDQRPLEQGYINFRPQRGATGPAVGAAVENGKYLLLEPKAVLSGKFRVEITATGRTGRKQLDDGGHLVEAEAQILPAKYNKQSGLQADVRPAVANRFDFSLTSR